MSRIALQGDRGPVARRRVLPRLGLALLLAGCAELAPLREPPILATDDPLAGLTTREEALARLGPPHQVRASDVGQVLVYRRARVIHIDPNRYQGEDGGAPLDRYEQVLLYLDADGRVVRGVVEPE